MPFRRALLSCIIVAAAVSGCDSSTSTTNPSDIVFPDTAVSYVRHVDPFLTLSCGFSGCHGEINPAGGVILTTYSGLMFSRPNNIVAGSPDESLVIQVLERVIPHPDAVLTTVNANHRAGMRQWVLEGALNN
jgi:hypothetical protein